MRSPRKAVAAFALLLAVARPATAGDAEAPAPGWEAVARIATEHRPFTAAFADPAHGWTAGYAGDTRYTEDGGRTWTAGRNDSLCRFGIELAGGVAWTVGNGGEVRRSADGGRTWSAVRDLPDPGKAVFVSFADARTGWVASPTAAWATADAGRTWAALRLPPGVRGIAAIALRAPGQGYLLDGAGTLFATADGGATWAGRPLPLPRGLAADLLPPMHALRVTEAGRALAVVTVEDERRQDRLVALSSEDGGATWRTAEVPAPVGQPFLTSDGGLLTVLAEDRRSAVVLRPRR